MAYYYYTLYSYVYGYIFSQKYEYVNIEHIRANGLLDPCKILLFVISLEHAGQKRHPCGIDNGTYILVYMFLLHF